MYRKIMIIIKILVCLDINKTEKDNKNNNIKYIKLILIIFFYKKNIKLIL